MKKQPMLKRNDDIELKIDALGSEGQGIGRMDGYAVFVPYALPSERVRAHVIKPSASYAVAKLTEIVEPSQKRCEPGCPAFGKCGGCALMHLEYASQLEYKRQSVYDALKRIGAADVVLPPVMGMDDPYRYRNKASFPVSGEGGAIRFGFYAPKSHRLVPLDDCLIERESLVAVAKTVCIWAEENDVSAYDEATGKGSLRHVMARETSNGEVMAAVVTKGALKARDELIGALTEAVPRLTTIIHNRNDGATNVIFGDRFETVFGPGRITETLAGLSFGISAASFLQVNTEQTEKLYALVDSMTPEGAFRAADVYCGVGTITLMLAKRAAHVTGIEYVPEAIEDARANAGLNNIKNVDFVCGDAARELPKLLTGDALDLIVVDPPRKGCGADVINAICSSGARSLIYVSCDPATLARDVKLLSDAYGIKRAQSVDMFPHTAHVETVVLITKKND